ncbi:MAG: hypothetical protein H7Z17_10810 [Fuerstia sp.]|nr:hypothetical protein [Fuerstiella sp.]
MLSNLSGRMLACCIFVTGFVLLQPDTVNAQAEGQLSEKPIAIFYARDMSEKRMFAYAMSLSERMNFAESFRHDIAESVDVEETQPPAQDEIDGYLIYLVSGPIPNVASLTFCNIVDTAAVIRGFEADFKKEGGDSGVVRELGNDCFVVERTSQHTRPLPENADEAKIVGNGRAATSNGLTITTHEVKTTIEEKDGKRVIVHTTTRRSFHRVYDQFLYEGESEKLFDMTLPSAADISAGLSESNDLGFCVYLDRVPQPVRQLGWTMLASGIGSQLQQYDGETDTAHDMRRASGDLALAIGNAALFDIDFSDGSLTFATEDVPSIDGELRIRARNNSGLSDKLQRAVGSSRFAPILHDNAAVTGHTCVRFPEESSKALTATSDWLKESFATVFHDLPALISVGDVFSETLLGMAEHRNLELLFKVGWTEESAGVVYGGVQLHDSPQLLPGIFQLMVHVMSQLMAHPQAATGNDQMIEMIQDGDMEFIRILLPDDAAHGITESWGAHITHIYLAHQNSCLWFAMGGENAKEIIRLSVARCNESNATRTPFVSARIDMERWLAWPQDDPTGIAQMPHWLDANAWWFPPNPLLLLQGIDEMDRKPQAIMQRAFDLGGSQQFSLTLEADESGLLLQTSLGEALANHLLARVIDMGDDPEPARSGSPE